MDFSIEKFVDRAIIIDDTQDDATKLKDQLLSVEISCEVFSPEAIEAVTFKKNRQLIFCDLRLNEMAQDSTAAAALIRKILSKSITEEFGAYGLILWTEHEDDVDDVKEKLSIDRKNNAYNTPIFVTSLSKLDYQEKGNYEDVIPDLNRKLKEDVAAYFFLTWGASVKYGFNKSTTDMYSLVDGYSQQSDRMKMTLLLLAQNYTGIPDEELGNYAYLSEDAYKASNDILCADLYNATIAGNDLFNGNPQMKRPDVKSGLDVFALINSKLFINTDTLDQSKVIPGNVYLADNLPAEIKLKDIPKDSFAIMIELTPPCDFSYKKELSRLVVGFMTDCPAENDRLFNLCKSFKSDSRYDIWPVRIGDSIKYLCFDFKHLINLDNKALNEASKYKLLLRLNHNLFADVLQKFSSHAARLGENLLKPTLTDPTSLLEITDEQKLVQRTKEKLKKGPFPEKDFRDMIRHKFDAGKDKDYLEKLLGRNGILIEDRMVKAKS